MERKRIGRFINLVFCLIFLPLVITLIPVDRWLTKYPVFATLLIVFLYLLFFAYRYLKIPRMLLDRQYLRAFLIMLAILATVYLLSHFPFSDSFSDVPVRDLKRWEYLRLQTVWLLFLVVTGFSFAIELTSELFQQILSKKDIETEKNKAELNLYKSQIDPHFLFNSLNTLYSLIVSKSENAEKAFSKFSDILRYMYDNSTRENIPLEQEIDYIKQYIDLQSLRCNLHTRVKWECEVENGEIPVPPMILITFVENAFKYGSSSGHDCLIRFHIRQKRRELIFESENRIMKKNASGSGIGIENCRKRLNLLYPGHYSLLCGEKDGLYRTRLSIQFP